MVRRFGLALYLISCLSYMAWAKDYLSFQIDGRWPLMVKSGEVIVSSHCFPISELDKCEVNRVLKKIKKDPGQKYNLIGGKHPGSVLCQQLLKGTVVMGRSTNGHSSSFCRFNDDSLISNNGLLFVLKEKGIFP